MAENAILEIIAGTVTIDLLQAGIAIGVNEWTPQSPPVLPAMQSSPLTSGSEVSSYKFGNAIETIDFKAGVDGIDQDDVIEMVQDFRRILIQGMNYQVVDWQNSIVYIRARASCETNIRYAVIKTYSLPEDDFPFGQPFFGNSVMDDMVVTIERGDWLGAIPGVGECQQINSQRDWAYTTEWVLNNDFGAGTDVVGLLQTSNTYMFAGVGNVGISRSINRGGAWVTVDAGSGGQGLFETKAQTILAHNFLAGSGRLRRSTDFGATWNTVLSAGTVYSFSQNLSNDRIYATISTGGGEGRIYTSDDDGLSWVQRFSLPFDYGGGSTTIFRIAVLNSGRAVFGTFSEIWVSDDDGINWSRVFTADKYPFFQPLQLENGDVLIGSQINNDGVIYKSEDDGETWKPLATFPPSAGTSTSVWAILEYSDSTLYTTVDDRVYISIDEGITWSDNSDVFPTSAQSTEIIEIDNGNIFVGTLPSAPSGGRTYEKLLGSTISMGAENSCNELLRTANKDNIANLTHIKLDDGGAFTDLFPMDFTGGATVDLLPAVPAVNDAIYFGIDTSHDIDGPFSSLVFDLAIPVTTTDDYSIVWEYYDSANWVLLTVTDGTNTGTGVFRQINVSSVHWEQPSDWTAVAVDGDTAFWVRARVALIGTSITSPEQQNRQIYSVISSHFQADDENIGGDIPALAEYRLFNVSDSGGLPVIKVTGTHTGANNNAFLREAGTDFNTLGVQNGWYVNNTTDGSIAQIYNVDGTDVFGLLGGGTDNDWDTNDAYTIISGPDLWSNRLITGLRSESRGSEFRAFINISDEQNVPGITVTAGTNAAFGADVTKPTGRRLTYSAGAGDTTFVDRAVITMSSGIVRDYYGRFHAFVRAKDHTASSGEITMRLQLRTGSGGITYTTPEQIFLGNNDWELLDFDAFTIPAGGRTVKPDDLGDTGVIAIQVKNDSGGAETVYIYDLVLIPTDEWAGDFTDLADIDDSIIGKQDNIRHFLDIDSVRNPKVLGRSLVRLDDANESISANYEFSTNGEVILQANADQRVWVVSAHIGSNDEWLSEPWLGWSVQAYKNQRYLTQRGSR